MITKEREAYILQIAQEILAYIIFKELTLGETMFLVNVASRSLIEAAQIKLEGKGKVTPLKGEEDE